VAAGVVDHLELVEVEVQHHVPSVGVVAHGLQAFGDAAFELAAVDQAGQRVVRGLVGQRALQAPLLAHVVEHHDHADQAAAAVADRRGRVLHRDFLAAPVDQQRRLGHLDQAAFAQAARDRAVDRLARGFRDHLEHFRDRPPGRLARIPARELLGDRVEVLDPAVGVRRDDRVADRLQRDLGLFLFLVQLQFCALAHGDVGDRAFVAGDLLPVAADHAGVDQHGDRRAVAASQLAFGLANHAVAMQVGDDLVALVAAVKDRGGVGQRQQLIDRFVAQHLRERRVDGLEASLDRGAVHAFDHVVEQAAVLRLAVTQGLFRALAFDRDGGERGQPAHQLEVAPQRAARLAEVQCDGAEHAAVGSAHRRRPAGAQAGFHGRRPQVLPQRVAGDLGHDDLTVQEDRGGARTVARADRDAALGSQVARRQPHAGHVLQLVGFGVVDGHGADRIRRDFFGRLGQGLERRVQVGIAGDALEHATIARRQHLGALALGDVGDAAADQPPAGGGQPHQADFAGYVVPERVAVRPLEARGFAGQRAVHVAAHHAERGRAVLLERRTDPGRTGRQQFFARHLEEAHRVLVALDEATGVHVEHDDRFRGMLDQCAVAGLALADRGFGLLAVGRLAHADDEKFALVEADLADADLGIEGVAVLVAAAGLARLEVSLRVLDRGREFLERIDDARIAAERRNQQVELLAAHVGFAVAEDTLTGGVQGLDAPGLVDRDDRVLDVVEDRLQLRGGALAHLAREGSGLVRQQAHRAHDALALLVPLGIGRADRMQQLAQVELARLPAGIVKLLRQ
jgi:hypothetical protein